MPSCVIPTNSDVSGIGIRAGIYLSSLLVSLIPDVTGPHYGIDKLHDALFQAAAINGFALVVTAIIQTCERPSSHNRKISRLISSVVYLVLGQLDLYHAFVIMHQLTFLSLPSIPGAGYRETKRRLTSYIVYLWATGLALYIWVLYVWITVKTFGSSNFQRANPNMDNSHDCNHSIKFVLVFVNIRATANWLKWFSIAGISFSIFYYSITPLLVWTFFFLAKGETGGAGHTYKQTALGSSRPPRDSPRPRLVLWPIFLRLLIVIYSIVNLELMIHRNNVQPGENTWSFGQVVAVVVALSGLNQMMHFLWGKEWELETEEDANIVALGNLVGD